METEQQTRGWANVHPVGKLSVSHCSHWTTFQTSHDYSCTKCQPALPSYLNPQLVFKTASHTRPLQTQHKNTISKGYDHTQILCKSSRSFVQSVSRQFLTQAQHLELSLHAPGNAWVPLFNVVLFLISQSKQFPLFPWILRCHKWAQPLSLQPLLPSSLHEDQHYSSPLRAEAEERGHKQEYTLVHYSRSQRLQVAENAEKSNNGQHGLLYGMAHPLKSFHHLTAYFLLGRLYGMVHPLQSSHHLTAYFLLGRLYKSFHGLTLQSPFRYQSDDFTALHPKICSH